MATTLMLKVAAPNAVTTIMDTWNTAVEETAYIDGVTEKLNALGFTKDNSIALVSTCRDEACRLLDAFIDTKWGLIFNLHGLAGVPSCGVLGVKAGCSHSPTDAANNDRQRYVFFGFTHIGVDETGHIGHMRRAGQAKISHACGALDFLTALFKESKAVGEPMTDNVEAFELKKKILAKDPNPTLVDVTNAAAQVVTDTLEDLISKAIDTSKADYAVITGTQIHTGQNIPNAEFTLGNTAEYVVPVAAYAVINGEKKDL